MCHVVAMIMNGGSRCCIRKAVSHACFAIMPLPRCLGFTELAPGAAFGHGWQVIGLVFRFNPFIYRCDDSNIHSQPLWNFLRSPAVKVSIALLFTLLQCKVSSLYQNYTTGTTSIRRSIHISSISMNLSRLKSQSYGKMSQKPYTVWQIFLHRF